MIIRVQNSLDISANNSFLSISNSSGAGTIGVRNINSFPASWAVQIGKTGEEKSEIKVIGTATPSGTALVLTANTTYDHPADTPVYTVKFDQIVFKKSTAGTSGTATAITGGTVSITPDSITTEYDDTSGATTHAYKSSFLNSVTDEESSDSDWLTSAGFSFYSLAKIRERAKNKLFNSGIVKEDSQVNDLINEWLEEMNSAIVNVDKSYSMGTVNVAFASSGLGTITSTDFQDLKRIWINYDGVNKYLATKRDVRNVRSEETFNATHPYYLWRGDDVFEIQPPQSGGTAEMIYYKRSPVLTNDTDELPFAMRSYSKSFVNYVMAELYYKDDQESKGDRYFARANDGKKMFINERTPREFTGVQTIQLTDVITPDDDYLYL